MLRPLLGLPVGIKDRAMARRLLFRSLPDAQVAARLARLVPEPARVTLDMALGLVRARPRPGREPRLLLAPERDYLFPVAIQRRLARRLGARLELLPGLPHEAWTEDNQGLVLGLLLEFLKGL
jgi:pimeloyl-ACP methyl ester carboxylesterase